MRILVALLFLVSCGKTVTKTRTVETTPTDLEERILILETALAQRAEELSAAKDELTLLTQNNDTQNEELETLQVLVDTLENKVEQLTEEISKLEEEEKDKTNNGSGNDDKNKKGKK